MESFTFFLPLTLLYLVAMTAMATKLKYTNDAFNIRHEIRYTIVATGITSATRTAHIALVRTSWWGDDDDAMPPTVHDLIACSAALYVSFYQPLKAFYGVGSRRVLRGIHSARRIYSREDSYDRNSNFRQVDNGEGGAADQNNPETWGVLQMLRNSTLRGLLINFCEQSLCGESVDFLVDVAIHYESLTDPEEQFASLSGIVENYLAEGSANEVNVSNAYRNAAGAWLTTKKDEFFTLGGELRAHVLDLQRDEIAKMLGENLLAKFKQTPLAIAAMRALKEVAAADYTGDGGEDGEDEGMRVMLQASAALEVARIQRMTRAGGDNPVGITGGIGGSKNCDPKRDNVKEVSYYSSDDESFQSYTLETGDA